MFKFQNVFKSGVALVTLFAVGQASASSLSDALVARPGFSYNPNGSYDGAGRNTLSFFSSFTDGNFYQLGTIGAQAGEVTYTASLISELGCFSGDDPNFQGENTNKFGFQDVGGSFETVVDTDNKNPLTQASFTQEAGKAFDFSLKSPEGLFYAKDSLNSDGGAAHMVGLKVTTAGTVNLGETTLFGGGPLSFNLEVGDIILFIEDMRAAGNQLIPLTGDFDYNDMVVVLRAGAVVTEVPEPATMALLGLGMFGGVMRRRKAC